MLTSSPKQFVSSSYRDVESAWQSSPMIGRCVHANGASLPVPTRGFFYTPDSDFHLTVGKDYPVLGVGIWDAFLVVLVSSDTGTPTWLPVAAFELQAAVLPKHWEFTVVDRQGASGGDVANRWVVVWGYPELVRSAQHRDDLLEHEPAALEAFSRELELRSRQSS